MKVTNSRIGIVLASIFAAHAVHAQANEFGISYESKPMPEGVSRVASWRDANAKLDASNLSYRYATPDAAFVKVYFDQVELPAGWALQLSSADGSQSYVYGAKEGADRTVDTDMGQNGVSSFGAMSIAGGEVLVRLLAIDARAKGSPMVRISHVLEGYPEGLMAPLQSRGLLSDGPEPASVCGVDDKRPIACFSGTQATRAQAVARLLLSGGGACTTWRVGSGNRFMTNNHCFSTSAEVAASELQFNYQNTTCAGTTSATLTSVAGASLLKTSSALDYSLYTVASTASLASFGSLSLDVRVPTAGETIYIPQHPGGRKKEMAVASGSDAGGLCRIGTASSGVNSLYQCDTEPGSSGSPVLASSSNKVINLHHLGGCSNAGVRISKIWPEISSFFNNVVP
jgi:hypothetical protein